MVYHSAPVRQNWPNGPTTPTPQRPPAITRSRFSLFRFRSPLLTESLLFSLPVGTEMFHFPTFPPRTLCVQMRVTGHDSSWVSPFGHPRITARLPTPRGLSQAPTSFIGSWCQGIHHVHLVACHYYKDARVHCVVLKQQTGPHPTPCAYPTGNPHRHERFTRPDGPTRATNQAPGSLDPSGPNSVPTSPTPPPRGSTPTPPQGRRQY